MGADGRHGRRKQGDAMTHRCNRCRTEYESGGFYNGMDYCTSCFQFLKQKDDTKRREEAERQQKIIEEKRQQLKDRLIQESARKRKEEQEELKRRRLAEEMKRQALRKLELDAEEQKKRKRHELMHQQTYRKNTGHDFSFSGAGSAYERNGIIPLDQQHQAKAWSDAVRKKQHEQEARQKEDQHEFRLENTGAKFEPRPFSLSVEKGPPAQIEAGKTVRVTLVGKNMRQKKEEVVLVALLKPEDGGEIGLEAEPKECFIEPGADALFEVMVPAGKAGESFAIEAYLKGKAYYIDPEQGKSETLELRAKIKGKKR
jgi:hypothetical protein